MNNTHCIVYGEQLLPGSNEHVKDPIQLKNIYSRNFIYAALLTTLTGCGKLQGTVQPANIPSSGHSATANSYQPVSKGSYWQYQYTKDGVTDTATVIMTGLGTTYGNVAYYEKSTSFKLHNFADATGYYSEYKNVYNDLTIAKNDTVNLYFFNDTTALNNTWTAKVNNAGIINDQQARFVGEIVEQNISLTVLGKTYTGVIHSKVYLQLQGGDNSYTTTETYDYFMVQGIGPIEIFTSTSSGSNSSQALIAYSIK